MEGERSARRGTEQGASAGGVNKDSLFLILQRGGSREGNGKVMPAQPLQKPPLPLGLDKDLYFLSDKGVPVCGTFPLGEFTKEPCSLRDNPRGDLSLHGRGRRPRTGGEGENMQIGNGKPLDEMIGLLEFLIRLPRKSCDKVEAEAEIAAINRPTRSSKKRDV